MFRSILASEQLSVVPLELTTVPGAGETPDRGRKLVEWTPDRAAYTRRRTPLKNAAAALGGAGAGSMVPLETDSDSDSDDTPAAPPLKRRGPAPAWLGGNGGDYNPRLFSKPAVGTPLPPGANPFQTDEEFKTNAWRLPVRKL